VTGDLRQKLEKLQTGNGPADSRPLIKELLETDLPRLQQDLAVRREELDVTPPAMLPMQAQASTPMPVRAIRDGFQKIHEAVFGADSGDLRCAPRLRPDDRQ
jgi:hypothetical protein